MNKVIIITICISGLICFFSCKPKSEYHKMVEREMASGIRQDSLFYGFYFGMPAKDFFDRCFKLNKSGWIRQGATNHTVYAKITELKYPASMDFYPTFLDNKIVGMPVTFTYESWAPWNRQLSADSLKIEVVGLMEKWYGEGFIKVENTNKFAISGEAFVNVNGNRRISIYNTDDTKVHVDFIDLTKKDAMEKEVEAKRAAAKK